MAGLVFVINGLHVVPKALDGGTPSCREERIEKLHASRIFASVRLLWHSACPLGSPEVISVPASVMARLRTPSVAAFCRGSRTLLRIGPPASRVPLIRFQGLDMLPGSAIQCCSIVNADYRFGSCLLLRHQVCTRLQQPTKKNTNLEPLKTSVHDLFRPAEGREGRRVCCRTGRRYRSDAGGLPRTKGLGLPSAAR